MTAQACIEQVGTEGLCQIVAQRRGFLAGGGETVQIDNRQFGLAVLRVRPDDGFLGAGRDVRESRLGVRQVGVEVVWQSEAGWYSTRACGPVSNRASNRATSAETIR